MASASTLASQRRTRDDLLASAADSQHQSNHSTSGILKSDVNGSFDPYEHKFNRLEVSTDVMN